MKTVILFFVNISFYFSAYFPLAWIFILYFTHPHPQNVSNGPSHPASRTSKFVEWHQVIKRANEQLCCWEGAGFIPEFIQWRIQRRGPGRDLPLPLSKGLDDRPLLISRSGSGIVIYHPNSYNTSPMLSLFAVVAGQRQGGINWNTLYFSKYINSHTWKLQEKWTELSWYAIIKWLVLKGNQ